MNKIDIASRNENAASAALCFLLRESPIALKTFWQLALRKSGADQLPAGLQIEHRHKTDQQREIDLLLHRGKFGIIVECKVDDEKKPYQFDPYVAYWRRTWKVNPHLVWLLERDRPVLGDKRFPVVTVTWAQLRTALLKAADEASLLEEPKIRAFCEVLMKAGIGRAENLGSRPIKRARGCDTDHAESILSEILSASRGMVGAPMIINALSPALHAGRPEWEKILDDEWVRRIWLYFAPFDKTATGKSPYHFHAQILLYHRGFGNKRASSIDRVPVWADALRKAGLSMRRNVSGTWNRGTDLMKAEGVSPGVCYIFGEETLQNAQRRFPFNWKSDAAAVKAGIAQLKFYSDLFDRVLLSAIGQSVPERSIQNVPPLRG